MKYLAIVLITAVITFVITVMCFSPQHAAVLKMLFWNLPLTILERIIPFYGS